MSSEFFPGARHSISDVIRLDLSDKDLVDRDDEIKILRDALTRVTTATLPNDDEQHDQDRARKKSELAIVTGLSGTGKSCLVKVALKDLVRQKGGFFIEGKFGQFSNETRSDSYSAILEALNQLCKLAVDHKDQDELVYSIQEILGNEAARLSAFIPGLQDLIGVVEQQQQQDDTVSEQGTSYARLSTLCRTLLRIIASRERPIVLFIDDLQWSDLDSLKLIRSILINECLDGLLIVGAYRNDEVDDDHLIFPPLLKKITAKTVRATTIYLTCLDESSVNSLVAFATELKMEETVALSQLIYQKTDGNCFFVAQFLEMLQDQRLLQFSFSTYKWEWNLEEIAAKTSVSENVLELVVDRISQLDAKSQEIFKIAGCLGCQFTVEVLHAVSCSMEQPTVDASTLGYNETNMSVEKLISMNLFEPSRGDWIKFSHDRIQEAASWQFVDEVAKAKLCLKIGRIVKDHARRDDAKNQEWLFFTATDLLNKGSQLVTDTAEKLNLANMNRKAAEKATAKSAFLPAACYNEAAIALRSETSWLDDPNLTMELHDATAECYLRCGRSQRSFEIAQTMIEFASSTRERLRGQCIQMEALEHQRRFDEGRELGLAMMRSYGVNFPRRPNNFHITRGFLRTKHLLEKHTDEELLNLPIMTNEAELAMSKMEFHLIRSLFYARNKKVLPLLWFRSINQALKFGLSPYLCAALGCFAILLSHLHDSKGATRFGRLSMLLCDKIGDCYMTSGATVIYYSMQHHWRNPIQSSIDPLVNGYMVGMKTGDVQMALSCALSYCVTYFSSGLHLDVLETDLPKFISIIEEYNLQIVLEQAIPMCQMVLILTGYDKHATDPLELSGRVMHEAQYMRELLKNGSTYAVYVIHTMKLRTQVFLGGKDKDILEEYRTIRSKQFESELRADFGAKQADFYGALAAIACFKQSGKRWHLRYARSLMRQMETYVKDGAINCVHMLQILKAEMMTCMKLSAPTLVEHHRSEVRRAFDDAISSASRSGFCQDAGLANERAALYHFDFDTEYANEYLRKAFQHYKDWGAGRKLDQLIELYPFLKREIRTSQGSGRLHARSRYEEDSVAQHKTLDLR